MKSIGDLVKEKGIEKYQGFIKPNTTPTPDDLFDLFLPDLKLGELKVLLYVIRRTFGFNKLHDNISMKQICFGIQKKNGEQLDRGTGLTRKSVIMAIKSLEKKWLIEVDRAKTKVGDNHINSYSLRFRGLI